MNKSFSLFIMALLCAVLCLSAFAADTVYVDGTGATEGAYTDFAEAVTALKDGGTIIVSGDTTIGTTSSGVTLTEVGGDLKIVGENGAKLAVARAVNFFNNVEISNITLVYSGTSSSYGSVIMRGNSLTIGENVVCEKAGNYYLSIYGGAGSATTTGNPNIVIKSGEFRRIYGGNSSGTFNGNPVIEIYGGTVGTIGKNAGGTFNGTSTVKLYGGANVGAVTADNITIDLTNLESVTTTSLSTEPTTIVPDGWRLVIDGGVYSVNDQPAEPVPTTVYVDGTGKTEGAYTTFADAFNALPVEGGTIVLTGDTQLGTPSSGVVLGNYKAFSGKITITSENGAKLLFARSLRLNTEVEFKNLHIHSIIPSNLTANNNILCSGNTFTVGEGVTMTKDEDAIYPCIVGGAEGDTSYDSRVIVKSGTWQNIYGGGYNRAFKGDSYVEVSNATIVGTLTAGSRSGTFSGTGSLVLNLKGDKTVSAATFDENPTLLVDEGYEGVLVDGTYMQKEISTEPAPTTVYLDGTGATAGAYTDIASAVAALENGGTVIVTGDTTVGTTSSGVSLAAVGGDLKIIGENGAKLTIARAVNFRNNVEIDNITLAYGGTNGGYGSIIMRGNNLTIGENVTCEKAGNYHLSIFGGLASGTCDAAPNIVIKSGTFRRVFGGNSTGTFNGNPTVEVYGATIVEKIKPCDGATFNGVMTVKLYSGANVGDVTADSATVDLTELGKASATSFSTSPKVFVPNGYVAKVDGGIYTAVVSADTVYLDGTGEHPGAYTDIASAVAALENGGTVIVTGDTTVGTTSSGVSLAVVGGDLKIIGENGAKLTIARAVNFRNNVEIDNITLAYGGTNGGYGSIIMRGNNLTIGENVTCEKAGNYHLSIFGGLASGTCDAAPNIVIKSGTFRRVFGGNSTGTFNGNPTVEVYGATIVEKIKPCDGATFNGVMTVKLYSGANVGDVTADSVTVDISDFGSVKVTSLSAEPLVVVPTGCNYTKVEEETGITYMIAPESIPTVVFVDGNAEGGDGLTEDTAVNTLSDAASRLFNGGTIVVCGDVEIDAVEDITSGGAIVITSVYDGKDYTEIAAVKVAANINLFVDTTFKDIVLEKASYSNNYICANGNKLVIDEGVYCRNTLATSYIGICGGSRSGSFTGNTDVTIKSGYFRNVFGGNLYDSFKGTTTVNFLGGYVDHMITGGNFQGNFEGTATVNIGGDAVVASADDIIGVMGATCGSGSTQYTFKGDIYINIFDSARVNANVYGTTYYSNVTTTGNVNISVKEDGYVLKNIYAGGYTGTLNGNTKVVVDGGFVGTNIAGGSRGGTVNGDTYVEINGGQINYYYTNYHSSWSEEAGTYNIGGGGFTGTVNGNTSVVINGGDIYGNVYGGAVSTGKVSGNSTVTLTGGSIMCGAYADGSTAGTVSGTKTLNIDLSKGGSLALGLPASVNSIVGGGSLTLFPEATITANTFSGHIDLDINGIPQARDYITATSYEGATVAYTAQDNEKFVSDAGKFGISSEGYYAKTKVIFKHLKGVEIYPRAGLVTSGDRMTADEKYDESTVFYLTPGLYNYAVYHSGDDYKRCYIYITGKDEEIVLDYTNYTAKIGNGYEASRFSENTVEIFEKYYSTKTLVGYETPDSPYFNNNREGQRFFTSHEEMYEFVQTKVASCDYAYMFDLFTSTGGHTTPVVIFTKDEIPENATLEDVAKIVTAQYGRDILMISAIIHGNEPSAGEGALAMISELAGEYGDNLIGGNVGAVVVVPRVNPDGCEAFSRYNPNATVTSDMNRDLMQLSNIETTALVRAMNLFEPTVFMDCHEAPSNPLYGQSNTLTDIYNVGLCVAGNLNTVFVDGEGLIRGDYENRNMYYVDFITEAMEDIAATGVRPYYYGWVGGGAGRSNSYSTNRGTLGVTVEVIGLEGGDFAYARRVFSMITAIKSVFNLVKESDGELAKTIYDAREKTALSAQKFDVDSPVVLDTSRTNHDVTSMFWNNPLLAADGTMRKEDNLTRYFFTDLAIRYRSRPTAYVVSADTAGLDTVLELLDKHELDYYELASGTTLNLKQYSGNATTAKLSAASDVTFENGAYIIPVDGYKAYVTALLFEPDENDSGVNVSLVKMGYLETTDIYRSEESFIAAKLGLGGTYIELATEGKTVENAVVDGVTYENVDTEGDNAYVVRAKDVITLNFTDGTSDIYYYSDIPGDINGDRSITVHDALMLVRAVVNGQFVENGDIDGDGNIDLADVIRIMKAVTQ